MKWIANKIFDVIEVLVDGILNLIDFFTPFFIIAVAAVYSFAWFVTWPLRLVVWLSLAFLTIITSPFKDFQAFIQENALFFKETLIWNKKKVALNNETTVEGIGPIIHSASSIDNHEPSKETNEAIPDIDVDIDLNIL